jgi:hypothetical protein
LQIREEKKTQNEHPGLTDETCIWNQKQQRKNGFIKQTITRWFPPQPHQPSSYESSGSKNLSTEEINTTSRKLLEEFEGILFPNVNKPSITQVRKYRLTLPIMLWKAPPDTTIDPVESSICQKQPSS